MDNGVLVLNLATMANVGLDENAQEVAHSLLIGAFTNDANAPGLERLGVGEEELLATKIPTTAGARVGLRASVLDLGCGEQLSLGHGHIGINLETEMAKVLVRVPLQHANSMLDSRKAFLGTLWVC